jgi:hypothetical protein
VFGTLQQLGAEISMTSGRDWRAEDLVWLTEHKFDDPEQVITALEGAIAAEARLCDWPVPEDRAVIRGKLVLRLLEQGRYFPQRVCAAFLAISFRLRADIPAALA